MWLPDSAVAGNERTKGSPKNWVSVDSYLGRKYTGMCSTVSELSKARVRGGGGGGGRWWIAVYAGLVGMGGATGGYTSKMRTSDHTQ